MADEGPGLLIDAVLPGSRRLGALSTGIAIIALTLGWGVLALVRTGSVAWPTMVLCVIGAVAGVLVFASVMMTLHHMRAERVLSECAGRGDGELIGRLAATINPISISDLLVKRGRWGVTGRLARERDFAPIEPIVVPFEPQLLGAGGRPRDLGEITAATSTTAQSTSSPCGAAAGGGRLRRAWPSFWSAISIVITLMALWVSWRVGLGWLVLICILGLGLELAHWLGPGALYSSRQCLAVPGGLVVRESGFLRQGWRLHVYDRRSSVLTAARKSDAVWFLLVADAGKKSSFLLKPGDVEFLLRAWLSPLRPPGVERLSDLQ